MPRLSLEQQIEKARKEREQKDAQLKALEARASTQKRNDDTRRKVVMGGIIMNHLDKFPDDTFSKKVRELADKFVFDRDRHLFTFTAGTPGPKAGKNGATPSASPAAEAAE